MLPVEKKQQLILFLILCTLALGMDSKNRSVKAREAPATQSTTESFEGAEVISDRSAEEMAREILAIQEKLGGSIVPQAAPLPERWPHENNLNSKALITDRASNRHRPTTLGHNPHSQVQHSKRIHVLRAAAFDLDRTAHELEGLDLYEQADSLRNVASRLRRDARELKRAGSPATEAPQFLTPPLPDASQPVR